MDSLTWLPDLAYLHCCHLSQRREKEWHLNWLLARFNQSFSNTPFHTWAPLLCIGLYLCEYSSYVFVFLFLYLCMYMLLSFAMPDTKASIWALKVYGDRALNKGGWHMKPWMAAYTLLSGGFPPLYSSTTVLGYPLYSCTTLLGYSTTIQQRVPKHPLLYSKYYCAWVPPTSRTHPVLLCMYSVLTQCGSA